MLGNPVTNCPEIGVSYGGPGGVLNTNNQLNLYYWHGMVSRENYDAWNNANCNTQNPNSVATCDSIYAKVLREIGHLEQPTATRKAEFAPHRAQPSGSINPDMLYYSYCTGNGTIDFNTEAVPDCFDLDAQVVAYLNTPAVQAAIHAQVFSFIFFSISWIIFI